MQTIEKLKNQLPEIEKKIGHAFKNRDLLWLAFVHRSFSNENKPFPEHNERLEFLGDAVLGVIAAEFLYEKYPGTPEGELSYLKSRLVEGPSCNIYIQKLGLENLILLGKGERLNEGRGRETILSDLFEAIVGAIYLDGGLDACRHFFLAKCKPSIEEILNRPLSNYKALLQDFCQKMYKERPVYRVDSEEGPEHNKVFRISVVLHDHELGFGVGSSKKEAQQAAAENAMRNIEKLNHGK